MRHLCITPDCTWMGTPYPIGMWKSSNKKGEKLRYNGRCCPLCKEPLISVDVIKTLERQRILSPNNKEPIGFIISCQNQHTREVLYDGKMLCINKIWIPEKQLTLPDCCMKALNVILDLVKEKYFAKEEKK